MSMKILDTELAAYITAQILAVKRGCFDAQKNGDVVLRLPDTINFTCEVVKTSYNGITRTQVQSPATTQTDDSSDGGVDGVITNTTYTEFSYIS